MATRAAIMSATISAPASRRSSPCRSATSTIRASSGIDCRYCHTQVENYATAGLPPTHTCMTCHSQIWTGSSMLAPVRDSLAKRSAAALAARQPAAGLRVFQPLDPHRQGRGLLELPWRGGHDAAHLRGAFVPHGVLPELPSRAAELPPPGLGDLQYGVDARRPIRRPTARRWSSNTTCSGRSGSPIARSAIGDAMSPNPRPLQWRSLEQLADTPAFRRFVEKEWPALPSVPVRPAAAKLPQADGRVLRAVGPRWLR